MTVTALRQGGRPIPHDLDAEALVLGSMLTYEQARSDACSLLVAEDFYSPQHADVFRALLATVVAGEPIQIVTIGARLEAAESKVKRPDLVALVGHGAYSWHGGVRIVAETAARRRAMSAAEEFLARAADTGRDFDETMNAWALAPDHIRMPDVTPEQAAEIIELYQGAESAWAVPGVLRRRERVIVTGGEGAGKSHLGRWVAMSCAAGRAPFGLEDIAPIRTLVIDLENESGDIGDAARKIASPIGYTSGCHARSRPQGIDLTQARDVRWLNSLVDGERPALVVIGPLYKMYRGADNRSKASEEAAEIVAEVLDDLRVKYDCALWIEAHAPHGENGNRDGGRPRGSSLWLGWPNFGRFMDRQRGEKDLVRLKPWRGDRHRQRAWPWALRETPKVPWVPVWTDPKNGMGDGRKPQHEAPKRTPYDEQLSA